jgi:hypothetical protein
MKHLVSRFRTTVFNVFAQAEEIFIAFDRVYGDPNRKMTAMNALRKLYQGKDTFYKFWAKFQRLTAELEMSEEFMITEFRYRVSYDL